MCYEILSFHSLIIIAFAIVGFGLKYIDDAFDEERFSKEVAKLLAPVLVVIWIGLSLFDSMSATILFSILFAVILSGKVDNVAFKLSSIVLIVILLLTPLTHLSLIPFFALTVMGVVDENGNDYVYDHKIGVFWELFFAHRCGMKFGTLGLCMVTLLPWLYIIALLAFDIAYEIVDVGRYLDMPNFSSKTEKFQFAMIILNKLK